MRRKGLSAVVAGLLVGVTVVCAGEALCDYYKYTDAGGTVCITNKRENVPGQYRKRMQIIRESALSSKDRGGPAKGSPAAPIQAAVGEEPYPTVQQHEPADPPVPHRWLRIAGFLAASVGGFFVVSKMTRMLSSTMLARIIYLGFFSGVFLFAYKSYADHLVQSYFSVKSRVLGMFANSNTRQPRDLEERDQKKVPQDLQ